MKVLVNIPDNLMIRILKKMEDRTKKPSQIVIDLSKSWPGMRPRTFTLDELVTEAIMEFCDDPANPE